MAAQVIAVIIFVLMFLMIMLDKFERCVVTLTAGAATMVLVFGLCMKSPDAILGTLNLRSVFSADFWYHAGLNADSSTGINWETIIFICGMMIMVEGMARVGFFRWLCMAIAKLVRFKPVPVLITFMLISAILSMFIDSITVILFLAAVTVELAEVLKFDPVPIIMAEVFCANLGGSSTMCGDPPNIIIGTSLGYTFGDFLTNTGLMALAALIFSLIYFYLSFHNELKSGADREGSLIAASRNSAHFASGTEAAREMDLGRGEQPNFVISDRRGFYTSAVIFLLAVILLVTHAQTGLTVATIGVIIGTLTLVTAPRHIPEILHKVDYHTLLFFVGLFIVVSGLEQTGILELIAGFIGRISGGNPKVMVAIIIWISGIASAFVDNIPFAATMIPVIRTLAETTGMDLSVLAWSLAMGTDIGGSATPIGASANVVGTSVAAKHGYKVTWGRYCKYMAPASIFVLLIATAIVWVRYF